MNKKIQLAVVFLLVIGLTAVISYLYYTQYTKEVPVLEKYQTPVYTTRTIQLPYNVDIPYYETVEKKILGIKYGTETITKYRTEIRYKDEQELYISGNETKYRTVNRGVTKPILYWVLNIKIDKMETDNFKEI